MLSRGWQSKEILRPRGAWTDVSRITKGNPARASIAQNFRFSKETADSREGTSVVFSGTAGKVTSMFQWLSPTDNHLIYLDGTVAKRRKLSDGTTDSLVTGLSTTRAISCADLGPRLYFCGFNTSGYGTTECRIYDGGYTLGVPNVDKAFAGPLTFTAFTPSDGGAGECTKGTHKIGFIFQSRSGFAGKPSPVSAGVFVPASITLNAQQRTISVSITLNTPADAGLGSAIYPIMTRADNPNTWFFVPDVFAVLPASSAGWTQVFTISVSDEDLANRAESADNQFNVLSQDSSGVGPFSPQFVAAYGKRMMYGVGNKVYASDPDDPQAVSEDFHVVQMPSQRLIAIGGQIGDDFYLFGDRWTGKVKDTGDFPSTWPQPTMVSKSLGTVAINGLEWHTGSQVWVPTEAGLYLFDGAYSEHPISHYQSDIWARINWAAAYAIQIADDITGMKVHVAVPLDGAVEPTHDLVFDYTSGTKYDACDFSLDNYAAANFSSIRMVKEATSARTSLYIGPSAAAGRVLKLDAATVNDVNGLTGAAAIVDGVWKSGYIRKSGEVAAKLLRVGAADCWMRGNGMPVLTWAGLDDTPSITPTLMSEGCALVTDLSSVPGQEYSAEGDLAPVENFTMQFRMNALDGWISLSGFKPYYKPDLYSR
jgi:hypothetical protein